MKAITLTAFGGTGNFRAEDLPAPQTAEGEVLIQIKATSFNPIDYQMRQGQSESKMLRSTILGREFAGVVMDTGSPDSPFNKGDAVYAYAGSLGSNGTYAEYISIPAGMLAKMPGNLNFEEATALPLVGLTALQCYERLKIPATASVFIAGGSGAVGNMLIKLLHASGVKQIVTTAGNSSSRKVLEDIGIDPQKILDYHQPDLIYQARKMNDGSLFDYCVDITGGTLSNLCSDVLKINGDYADIAFLGTDSSRETLFGKSATIHNIANYAMTLSEDKSAVNYYGDKLTELSRLVAAGIIEPPLIFLIGDLSVEAVQRAHTMLETNQARGRKIVMRIS